MTLHNYRILQIASDRLPEPTAQMLM